MQKQMCWQVVFPWLCIIDFWLDLISTAARSANTDCGREKIGFRDLFFLLVCIFSCSFGSLMLYSVITSKDFGHDYCHHEDLQDRYADAPSSVTISIVIQNWQATWSTVRPGNKEEQGLQHRTDMGRSTLLWLNRIINGKGEGVWRRGKYIHSKPISSLYRSRCFRILSLQTETSFSNKQLFLGKPKDIGHRCDHIIWFRRRFPMYYWRWAWDGP